MKTVILSVISIILGLVIIIGLSIWVGFPSPEGFDRLAICFVGYMLGAMMFIVGVIGIIVHYDVL